MLRRATGPGLLFDVTCLAGLIAYAVATSEPGLRRLIGIGIATPAFSLWMLARFQLGDSFTARAAPRDLVTHGLYSRVRNPIYLFGQLGIVGLYLISGWLWVLIVLGLTIPLQIYRARVEARALDEKFGERYRRYKARAWF